MNNKHGKILIVDDTPVNIKILMELLKDNYKVIGVTSGRKAIEMANKEPQPDLIILDIMMPEMDGYEVCSELKSDERTRNIPVIFLTAMSDKDNETKGLKLGAVDYITKPFNAELIETRISTHIELKRNRDNLKALVDERTKEILLTRAVMIETLGTLAEYRDPETGGHIKRTQNFVKVLAKELSRLDKYRDILTDEYIELLYQSAPMHDIGKVGIRDCILSKHGKLTDEEIHEIQSHCLYGYKTLETAEQKLGKGSFISVAKEMAYTHHEKWNGRGYPNGLKGDDIPISGRIMALADVYDALISKRVYKEPFSHEKAFEIIMNGDGRTGKDDFDPDVTAAFAEVHLVFKNIAGTFADYDEELEAMGVGGGAGDEECIPGKRILIVDDYEINLEIMKAQVGAIGYETETARNGLQALNLMKEHHFDMVLTDIDMPVMDGYEFAKELRDSGSEVPVIAVTASDYTLNGRSLRQYGFDCYMLKPLNDRILRKKITMLLKNTAV